MAWQVVKNENQDVVHIIPLGDFEPHDEVIDCRCEPERREVEGGACDLLIHQPYNPALAKDFHAELVNGITEQTEFII